MSPAYLRSGEVWWLSIVCSALEPDSQVIQPRGQAGKDARPRGLLLHEAASPTQPSPTQPNPHPRVSSDLGLGMVFWRG